MRLQKAESSQLANVIVELLTKVDLDFYDELLDIIEILANDSETVRKYSYERFWVVCRYSVFNLVVQLFVKNRNTCYDLKGDKEIKFCLFSQIFW